MGLGARGEGAATPPGDVVRPRWVRDTVAMERVGPPNRVARESADYFKSDPDEPHWRWHAAHVADVLERASGPQVREWLAPMVDTFRLRFVTLHERLDRGERPTVSDHDWRAMFDLQERIERHLDLRGNPVDGAINHTLRRFGQAPRFGVVDRRVWVELLTPAQITEGLRPEHLASRGRIGIWRWDGATASWRSHGPQDAPVHDGIERWVPVDGRAIQLLRDPDGGTWSPHPDTPPDVLQAWVRQQFWGGVKGIVAVAVAIPLIWLAGVVLLQLLAG